MFKPIQMTIRTDSPDMYDRLESRMRARAPEFIGGMSFMCISVRRSSSGVNADLQEFTRVQLPWDGEGLPPVGTECMTDKGCAERRVRMLCHGQTRCFVLDLDEDEEYSLLMDARNFRPIRTPEQIEANKRDLAIKDLMRLDGIYHAEAASIYDAGYRKTDVK